MTNVLCNMIFLHLVLVWEKIRYRTSHIPPGEEMDLEIIEN